MCGTLSGAGSAAAGNLSRRAGFRVLVRGPQGYRS